MKKYITIGAVLAVLLPSLAFASFDTSLALGAHGQQVLDLQNFLTTQGVYSGPITGTFGALTKKGVISFQKAQGVTPASGVFGPQTRAHANQLTAPPTISAAPTPTASVKTTTQQTFTTPSGAILDSNGKVLQAPPTATSGTVPSSPNVVKTGYQICSETFPNETWDGTYGADGKYNCMCNAGYGWNNTSASCQAVSYVTTQTTSQKNALTAQYNNQINALNQQILDIKTKYYSDLAANNSNPVPLGFQQGRAQNLLDAANSQIAQIQLQEQQLQINYQSQINRLQ